VAVVGLGAAGGVAVLPLARAGLKVAGIEAGTWMDPRTFKPDELHNNVRGLLTSVPKANQEVPTSRKAPGQSTRRGNLRPLIHPMMNAIGGTSVHYWAQSWRLHSWDFKTRSEVTRRYGAGALPKGSTLEDWPIGYDDLEPFYDLVEHEVGVSGKGGNLQGQIDPRGNVFEAPRQREYPMPPLRGSGFTDHMAETAKRLGWKPFRPPAAINSEPYKGRPGCVFHGHCSRGGCHISAKNSTAVTTIPAALETRNLTIFDLAQVRRIEVDANGRATGVTYIRGRKEYFQPAKAVLVAGYTYENSRLLLLSRSKAYPKGLSNNHGQVGRHYFGHQTSGVAALFPFDINVWYGTPAQAAAVDDFADDNYDHSGLGFIGGSCLQPHAEMHPIEAAAMSTFGQAPTWGSRWKAFVRQNAARWTTTYLQTSSFPYEHTYLDLDDEVSDPLGDPVCRITSGNKENEARAVDYGQRKMEQWLRAAGATEVNRPPVGGIGDAPTTHAYGGTRMGDNPETSVVDKFGFSHEAPNLGVLGASVMGTSGARNPTLTVQALAWRTAEHLAKNWKSIFS
jgi:gluconate 2-dehydrogenase alpha chain